MTDCEVMQMALDALTIFREWEIGQDYNSNRETVLARAFKAEETLRAALAQGEKNGFNPDWDAMAVMVEEQQRLAKKVEEVTDALQAALAQPEQQPVAWRTFDGEGGYDYRDYEMNENYASEWGQRNPNHKGWVEPLYTAPLQREWQGLTDEEVGLVSDEFLEGVLWAEAKLKEKNT